MPQYRSECRVCGHRFDWFSPRMTDTDPPCEACGAVTDRRYFPIATIWSKNLSEYGDPTKETYRKDSKAGGHWTFEKRSDRAMEEGRPIPVFIDTPQKQREYCKREGLLNPKDLPANLSVAADGEKYETANVSEI